MNLSKLLTKNKVKLFILVWVYFITLFFVLQISFFLSTLLNQKIVSSWTLCVPNPESVSTLVDSLPERNSSITFDSNAAEACPGIAIDLVVQYEGNLFTYLSNEKEVREVFKRNDVRTIRKSMRNEPKLGLGAFYGFSIGLICALVFLGRQRKRKKFISRPVSSEPFSVIGMVTVAYFLGLIVLVWLPFQLFLENIKVPNYLILETDDLQFDIFAWIFFVVLAPFTEEILFRAWLLDAWRKIISPTAALLLSSIVFSAVHPMGWVANLIFIVPGLLLGGLWLRTRSLAACVIAHSSYNAFVLFTLTELG
jgi:membrane protease YdiL (CAAX protease family)